VDGTLYFASDDNYFYAVGPLTPVPEILTVTPHALTFRKTTVGTSSKPTKVNVFNPRGSRKHPRYPVLIEPIFADSAAFIETDNCPVTLAAGNSCTILMTFTPSTAGEQTANLEIFDNAEGSPQTVKLVGNGK
jgi:hypothetical protein